MRKSLKKAQLKYEREHAQIRVTKEIHAKLKEKAKELNCILSKIIENLLK